MVSMSWIPIEKRGVKRVGRGSRGRVEMRGDGMVERMEIS